MKGTFVWSVMCPGLFILFRFPNPLSDTILSISLKTKSSSVVVEALSSKNIFVNSVSACNSKNDEPSHVLLAMNKSNKIARNVIRISFSHFNTIEECKEFISELNSILYTIKG